MRWAIPAAVTLLVAIAVAVPVGDTLAYRDAIHPGVSVWGVDVGGMTPADATTRVDRLAAERLRQPLGLRHAGGAITIVPADVGVTVDSRAVIRDATTVSGDGRLLEGLFDRLRLWWSPRDLHPAARVDPAADSRWQAMLDEVALSVERLPKDARLMLTDDGPKAIAADDGVALQRDALEEMILGAVVEGRVVVDIPLSTIPPAISTDEAREALTGSRVAFSAPVELGYQGRTFVLTPQELLTMAAVNPGGVGSGLPLTFDTPAAETVLVPRLAEVATPPVDAKIVPGPDGRGFTVEPGRDGTLIEWDALFGALARAALSSDRRYVPIPTTPAPPRLSTEDAQDLGLRREIASFTTYFSPANLARVNNIKQVSTKLDGILIRPGETFSFNETVGPRTRAAGYDEAPVIRDGVLTPGVGGGICQVSTTLFNAAFFAGLPIVERHPHSFFIDHYPVGRDATVSYGSADLRFRNDSQQFILVTVTASDDSVTVSLAAPEWDRSVDYETAPFKDVVPPRSTAAAPRRLRDPALAYGQASPLEEGVDGRTVEVKRRVTRENGSVLFDDAFVSTYEPKDFIVRVGG